jgi:hypothetical protein
VTQQQQFIAILPINVFYSVEGAAVGIPKGKLWNIMTLKVLV